MFISINFKNPKIILMVLLVFIMGVGCGILYNIYGKNYIKLVFNQEINKQLKQTIDTIIDIRNEAVLNNNKDILKQLYNRNRRNGLWAYEYETRRMNYLHNWAKKQNITFNNINSEVNIRRFEERDNGFILNLMVSTEYKYSYNDSEKSNTFRLGTYHSLDLTSYEDKLLISREWYSDPFDSSLRYNENLNQNIKEVIMSQTPRNLDKLNNKRKNAVKYVDKYCGAASPPQYEYQYNSDYRNYNYLGGDCANFASQMLYEGGNFSKNSVWNYSGGTGSRAWVNADAFHNYMVNSGRGSIIARGSYEKVLETSYELLPGDYIAYQEGNSINHISVVTGQDSKGYILVNSHNSDRYRVPWDLGWNNSEIKFNLVRVNY